MIATHLDRMNDPRAAKAWADLGEQTATDLAYQSQVLGSPARFRDRDLWAKTIDRVRGLTGDDGSLWKTERARWLLADPAATPKTRAEAIGLLTELIQRSPDSVEAHVLLGLAFGRDGQRERAAEALTVAASKAPARADIGLELVQALRAANKPKDALGRLKDVAALPALSADQRVRAAGHFADLGQPGTAAELLTGTPEGGERDALLGRLYRAMGRSADAAAAYKRVLNDPVARPGDVFAGADFFAAAGDAATTRLFLDRLQTMPQSDAVTQMALGQFEEAYGSADKARVLLTKATQVAPTDPLGWRALAGFLVRSRKYADAAQTVDAGLAAVGGDAAGAAGAAGTAGAAGAELAALKPLVATVRGLSDVEPVRPLVEYLTKDPTNPAATDMLQVLADGQAAAVAAPPADRAGVAEQTRDRLAKLADKHPGSGRCRKR
jgi:tetratricopeptide (TPR) repeat protein